MAARELVVLLAVAALLAAAAMAVDDDDKSKPWKCFRPCAKRCHDNNNDAATAAAATMDDFPSWNWDANISAVTGECKSGCHDDECFEDLPAISYPQCVVATCLSHPHHGRKITACLKHCCHKCFHSGPPTPGPSPPKPSPPGPPEPGPSPPGPPEPGPSPPGPPEPGPGPTPPSPSKPSWTLHG